MPVKCNVQIVGRWLLQERHVDYITSTITFITIVKYFVDHSLKRKFGAYISMRHNL